MNGVYGNASASSSTSSSLNSSSQDTEDDHTIAAMLAEDEKFRYDGKLGKRLSHLDSIPVFMNYDYPCDSFYIWGMLILMKAILAPVLCSSINSKLYNPSIVHF